jgi:hypothetical protein
MCESRAARGMDGRLRGHDVSCAFAGGSMKASGYANHDGIAGRLDEGESAMPIKKSF